MAMAWVRRVSHDPNKVYTQYTGLVEMFGEETKCNAVFPDLAAAMKKHTGRRSPTPAELASATPGGEVLYVTDVSATLG